jgi:hypothetical protein
LIAWSDCYQVGSVSIAGRKTLIGEVLREWKSRCQCPHALAIRTGGILIFFPTKQLGQFSAAEGEGPDVATMTVDEDDCSSL